MSEFMAAAANLVAAARAAGKTTADTQAEEVLRMLDVASDIAWVLERLADEKEKQRPWRVTADQIVDVQEDGGMAYVHWLETDRQGKQVRKKAQVELWRATGRVVRDAAVRLKGQPARLLGGYDLNTNGWSKVDADGNNQNPDTFRRLFRILPAGNNNTPAQPAESPARQTAPQQEQPARPEPAARPEPPARTSEEHVADALEDKRAGIDRLARKLGASAALRIRSENSFPKISETGTLEEIVAWKRALGAAVVDHVHRVVDGADMAGMQNAAGLPDLAANLTVDQLCGWLDVAQAFDQALA